MVLFDATLSFILIYVKVKQYEFISYNLHLFIPPPSKNIRSSSRFEIFCENCGLKISQNSQRKYQGRSHFLIKLQSAILYKKGLQHKC